MDSKRSVKSKIIAHLDGELSVDELKELFAWIAKSKDNARYYTEIKDFWEASVSDASEIAETRKEWERFLNLINNKKRQISFNFKAAFNTWRNAAAILIAGILIGSILIKISTPAKPLYFTSIAPKGSVSQMVLPDNTIIYLNSGTEIKYIIDNRKKRREVFLKGEAWFKVAKMESKPFVVHTPFYNVNVSGTEFNVKAYESDSKVVTTLEEGSVLVSSSDALKMVKNIKLLPGEQLTFEKENNKLQVKKVNTKLFTSWKDNKLIFINMSLKELIVLIERKYDVGVEVEDDSILDFHYSGTIKNESILELLNIIKYTLPIQYKIENQKIIISNNSKKGGNL